MSDVVTLPANFAPVPQPPSKAVERLLAKREKEHNFLIDSMQLKCEKLSQEIEEEIEKESGRFKENMDKIKDQVENELLDLRRGRNLTMGVFQSALSTIQNDKRLALIDSYYENLKILEKKRSKCFKSVLQEGYRKSSKLGHVLPYELLTFFENKIVRMNQITMDNYSHYAKLHSELKLRVQEEIRVNILEIIEARDKYKMAVKMAKLREVIDAHKFEDGKLPELTLSNLDAKVPTDVPRTVMDVEVWSRQMKTTLDHLDANAKKLVGLYKTAVVHIFNRFVEELQNIAKVITEDAQESEISLDVDIDNEMYKTIVDDVTEIYKCDFAELQNLWDNITGYMESNISNTYVFLNSSAHLWDAYFNRVADVKNLIIQDLKLLIDKHDKASQDFDKRVHITLDKLRQESTVPQLVKHLKEANKILDSIAKLYQKQCEAEIKLLEKYNAMIDQSIELLISEIDRFLSENAGQKNIEERKSRIGSPDVPSIDPREKFIPDQMKVCQFEVEAVNNWMFGLWEAIRLYMTTCHKELSDEAQKWMDKTVTKLKKRLEVRLATHKPRYLRIKTMIYDVRLKELEDHMNELHQIEERVHQSIIDSKRSNQTSNDDRLRIFEEYEETMREIEEKLKNATRSQHVAASIQQSKTSAEETRKKLNASLKTNHELLQKNLDDVKKLICSFSKSIQLFAEGGNYSRDEAKIITKKIKKLKKHAPKKFKRVFAELDTIATQILKNFEQTVAAILERMELSKEEFEHNEAVCGRIKDLRSKIRNYAYEVKFKIHRIDADIDYYEDVSNIDIWKKKQFDMMKNIAEECVKNIIEMADFLTIGSYLFELNKLINESYEEIEKMAKGFYAKHGPIINKGKVQKNLSSFMEEVKKTHDGFGVQVEVHCVECLQDLIQHVLRFLRVNDRVYEGLVKKDEDEELGKKLVRESIDLEKRKSYLEMAQEEIPEDAAVTEIILKNEDRVAALHFVILKAMERVRGKVEVMEEFVQETDGYLE